MNLKVSFAWSGLVIFALPMLINIAYSASVMVPRCRKARSVKRIRRKFALLLCVSDNMGVLRLLVLFVLRPTRSNARFLELPVSCSPSGTQKSRHAGACRLTACNKGLPPQV